MLLIGRYLVLLSKELIVRNIIVRQCFFASLFLFPSISRQSLTMLFVQCTYAMSTFALFALRFQLSPFSSVAKHCLTLVSYHYGTNPGTKINKD